MSIKRLNQSGAVSIITVVLFTVIITVIVTVYARTSFNQQRESAAYDFGTRAYYAAESGVQDAVRALNTDPALAAAGKDDCQPLLSEAGKHDGKLGEGRGYSCQLIDVEPSEITGSVSSTKNAFIAVQPKLLTGLPNNFKLIIDWSKNSTDGPTFVTRPNGSQQFPSLGSWSSGTTTIIPVLRASVIDHPVSSITRDTIRQHVYFLNPVSGSGTPRTVNAASPQPDDTITTNAACFSPASGNSHSGYACRQEITLPGFDFANNKLYLRLSSLYGETKFRLQIQQNNQPTSLVGAQATIDVTGYVGGTYRRVKQAVPIGSGYREDIGLDAALVGGDGICKHFGVGNSQSEFIAGCTP